MFDFDEVDMDLLAEARAERRRRAAWNHWCDVCHGHLGAGSPCAPDDEEQPAEEDAE